MGAGAAVAALAFPGQGVDPVDTAAVLSEHADHALVLALSEVTHRVAWEPADLADTRLAQPCIVAAGLLSAEAHGIDTSRAAAGLGHSLGEITALAWAGAIPPVEALRLCRLRAEIGHAQQLRRPGRMVALMHLSTDEVEQVRAAAEAATGGVLGVAVENGPRQIVLSGDEAAADAAVDLAFERGGKARRLGIGGAFHTPLLAWAVDEFAAASAAAVSRDPAVPVVCSTGGVLRSAGDVAAHLGAALVRPVRWPEALAAARGLGVSLGIDAGPGATLARLARHTPVLDFEALRAI